MTTNIAGLAAILGLLAACARPPPANLAEAACPAGRTMMAKVELYFGLAIPGGGEVSEAAWEAFLEAEVTRRFPDGLSVDEVSGQWRDAATGNTVREPSRVVMILYAPSPQAETAIEEIRVAYKVRFKQDSVMRVDGLDCVGF